MAHYALTIIISHVMMYLPGPCNACS